MRSLLFTAFVSGIISLIIVSCFEGVDKNDIKNGFEKEKNENLETNLDSDIVQYIVNVKGTHLRLREGPSTDSRVVAKLYKGHRLEVFKGSLSQDGDWIRVKSLKDNAIGYVHRKYIVPYSNDYYNQLIAEYFPLEVGNIWMYHVEPASQDMIILSPKKLEIIAKKDVIFKSEKAEVFLIDAEDDLIIAWMAILFGDNDEGQIPSELNRVSYNSFIKLNNTVYLGTYNEKILELGPIVFAPSEFQIKLFGGSGELSYRHETESELTQVENRVKPIYPICEYKYISNDLTDEFGFSSSAIFSRKLGLYELRSSSDAFSGILLCKAKIDGEYFTTEQAYNKDKASPSATDSENDYDDKNFEPTSRTSQDEFTLRDLEGVYQSYLRGVPVKAYGLNNYYLINRKGVVLMGFGKTADMAFEDIRRDLNNGSMFSGECNIRNGKVHMNFKRGKEASDWNYNYHNRTLERETVTLKYIKGLE